LRPFNIIYIFSYYSEIKGFLFALHRFISFFDLVVGLTLQPYYYLIIYFLSNHFEEDFDPLMCQFSLYLKLKLCIVIDSWISLDIFCSILDYLFLSMVKFSTFIYSLEKCSFWVVHFLCSSFVILVKSP
jgi:hypothetical protein